MKSNEELSESLDLVDEGLKLTKSEREKILQEHFELQISGEALSALESKEYIKAAMLSWSYIEEYYLPTTIKLLTNFHKLPLKKATIEKATVSLLINYYYLLSHDNELYRELENARKDRNSLVHNLYSSATVEKIDEIAKKSAKTNIDLITSLIWDREEGRVQYPSTMIAINARNDLRNEQRKRLYDSLR